MSYTSLLINNKYQAIVFIYILIVALTIYFYQPFKAHPRYDDEGNVKDYAIDGGRMIAFF